MDAVNPYAPPQAPLAGAPDEPSDADLPPWRLDGNRLIVRHRAQLPDICLFTGQPTAPAQRFCFPLSWTPAGFRLIAVLFPLPALFAYNFARKTSTIDAGLSAAGRKRRRFCLLLTLLTVASGMLLAFLWSTPGGSGEVLGLAGLLFFAFLFAALAARVFRVVKIDRHYTHLAVRPAVTRAFALLPPPQAP